MFFRVLIFLILFYYLFKIIGRIFLPLFISHRINKKQREQQRVYKDYIRKKKGEEGEVVITYEEPVNNRKQKQKSKSSNSDNSAGEYVDFEEVK
ncbi:DUF4834 family protein [Marinilabiliaceae bacterium ANBcel2]|nr:DUF4834 family protein [Marinilabiliaceae bacterium ANBcel2]